MKPQFLIAAPHSGAGKTTVTLGILRALRNRGLNIQPFKCGPDYLDPKLHAIASGRQSINLDRFMMDDVHIHHLYNGYGSKADVLITEGVMGLFDGAVKMEGSSADIACLLRLPVILVINAKAMAYSAAALLLGFKMLRPDLHIAGVIFNFVEHESHYQVLKTAAEDVGLTPLGFLPKNQEIEIPSRHLGLKTGTEIDHDTIIEKAAGHIEKHIDLDELMRITAAPFNPAELSPQIIPDRLKTPGPLRKILVAHDEAFNFIYPENIRSLSALGELNYFSPLKDTVLPPADLIYLPGGYPELHLETLSGNKTMIAQLQKYHKNGGRILAECGGMMYLGKYIADEKGTPFPMTGILNVATGMQHKKLSL
ncbi:MAG TPA: cobyrinate a,c-diamide synthase, partial [Pedobacter sp.]